MIGRSPTRIARLNKVILFTMERNVEKARQDRMRRRSSAAIMRLSQTIRAEEAVGQRTILTAMKMD